MQQQQFSLPELKYDHNSNCAQQLVAIKNQVVDITSFQFAHPGGAEAIAAYAGKDATTAFTSRHSHFSDQAQQYFKQYTVGEIGIQQRKSFLVTLFSFHKYYVSVEKDGTVIGNRKEPKAWEVSIEFYKRIFLYFSN